MLSLGNLSLGHGAPVNFSTGPARRILEEHPEAAEELHLLNILKDPLFDPARESIDLGDGAPQAPAFDRQQFLKDLLYGDLTVRDVFNLSQSDFNEVLKGAEDDGSDLAELGRSNRFPQGATLFDSNAAGTRQAFSGDPNVTGGAAGQRDSSLKVLKSLVLSNSLFGQGLNEQLQLARAGDTKMQTLDSQQTIQPGRSSGRTQRAEGIK